MTLKLLSLERNNALMYLRILQYYIVRLKINKTQSHNQSSFYDPFYFNQYPQQRTWFEIITAR